MNAIDILRIATGAFFAISGYNKLTNSGRHQSIVDTFKRDKIPFIPFMQWWVPGWEFVGGSMLIAGLFSQFAAMVLFIICIVACFSEAKGRVAEYKPINAGDTIDDYLYLPEVVYALILLVLAIG